MCKWTCINCTMYIYSTWLWPEMKAFSLVFSLSPSKSRANIWIITILHVSSSYVCHHFLLLMFSLFFFSLNKWRFSNCPFTSSIFAGFRQKFQGYSTELNFNLSTMCVKMYSTTLKWLYSIHTCYHNFLNKLTQVLICSMNFQRQTTNVNRWEMRATAMVTTKNGRTPHHTTHWQWLPQTVFTYTCV